MEIITQQSWEYKDEGTACPFLVGEGQAVREVVRFLDAYYKPLPDPGFKSTVSKGTSISTLSLFFPCKPGTGLL